MAANMQHMPGGGQTMQQPMRKPTPNQLQQIVYQNLVQHTQPFTGICWQSNVAISDRMGKTMNLITNISLAMQGGDFMRGAEWGCNFEREAFHKSPTKEAYDQEMSNKVMEFYKRRQANEPNIQNSINVSAQAQAAQAQAQAMMNMQMGRGMGQVPQQGFQPMQHPMQGGQMGQGQQQQIQMGGGMGMNMNMANQAGRGMGPGPQMMGMPGGQNRPQASSFPQEMARLSQQDKNKVSDLAQKMFNTASEQQKANTRMQLSQRLPPTQLAEFQAQGKDPLMWFYQNQAFQVLKANMNRLQQQAQQQGQPQQGMAQNANNNQAPMMQQQASQQSLRQQQPQLQQQQQGQQQHGMMNGNQGGNDFTSFTNMESIKDQQMNGLMAQQAGQMVVPASGGQNRNPTPQPMGQNGTNQQGPNQGPRPSQQQQPQQNMNLQQMKMNQAAQQSQAQLQAQQMKQMQNQPGMGGNMQPSQSPAMNTLNTPVSRPANNMNQAAGQGGVQFGDQRFNQGTQRPNNQTFQTMLASLPQEQRAMVSGLTPDKLNEVMQRWQTKRQEQMGLNGGQSTPGQMPNRPPSQMGAMNPVMGGQMPVGMPQQPQNGMPMNGNQQQMQMPRIPPNQQVAMMDSMDLPPQVLNQLHQVPPDMKKWGQLKLWLQQNNIPQNVRTQLAAIQQKQFQLILQRRSSMMPQQQPQGQQQGQQQLSPQQGQQPQQSQQPGQNNANPGMQAAGGPGPNPMQAARPQMPQNLPPQVLQVSPHEMQQVRTQRPNLAQMPDDQLRNIVIQMKKHSWMQQQQMRNQQAQAQAQAQVARNQGQGQGQQGAQNQMGVPQAPMQLQQPPQPNQTPQPQNVPMPNAMGQNATPQTTGQKQPSVTPEQARPRQQPANNRAQPPNPSPASAPKNLKRPSNDDNLDVPEAAKQAPARPASQSNQPQQPQGPVPKLLTPQQVAALSPENRAKYEQVIKMQMMNKAGQNQAGAQSQVNNEIMIRLKALGQEEQKQSIQEVMHDIPMTPEEHTETATKLQRIVVDMSKIGRGLSRWYGITRDDARAKMFFRTRWRILKQFSDGEKMSLLKDTFSIRSSEIDQARAMLESMAKDLAASVHARNMNMAKQQGTPQAQNAQLAQPQQPMPQQQQQTQPQGQAAPVNGENLRRNSQAQSTTPKGGNKGAQAPAAPTTSQPPFQFGASSPHGNPSYVGKPKEINLQLPPSRKKQKTTGQTPQGATPSPQISKKASPELRRASEAQVPHKPVLLCKEPECEFSTTGYSTEQALQQHVLEEHTKPREDPMKFVQENLALALGLEPDGSIKKEPISEAAPMSLTNSKQGQTPVTMAATPVSIDGGMKRSASSMGKPQDNKAGAKASATPKLTDGKVTDITAADPWANATIDTEMLVNNLGVERGYGFYDNPFYDYNALSYLTPRDTPDSAKDGGSEPNSDISEGASLEINFDWTTVDTDLLLNMNNTNLEGSGMSVDPAMLFEQPTRQPDWDDVKIDFSKPFQLDTSRGYYMATN
ncbi:hypothetical protein NW762_002852 [Fusarium torreyae]|uniref:Mediator complex subunit 15 KIX domain-containing protein n=1 Tax=Fusarium torreyae TaxID=1237075 RepID=A0A9W8SAL4_9HYPO|nr:hypothetical protein NW762_002852 [Fusarium torreyae]